MSVRPSRVLNLAFCLCALLTLAGCGSTYRFKVDAVKNPDVAEEKHSYHIASGNPEMDSEDLRFKEAAKYVKTALSSKGMYEAPPGTEAEMVVEVDFGMEEPRTEIRTVSVPVYIYVSSPPRLVRMRVRDPKTGQIREVEMVVQDPPRQELAGFEEHPQTVTIYEKYIRITARETAGQDGDRPPREIWSVYVKNEDENDNLRDYVPLMVSAAMDSVDENGSTAKEVVLNDSDERVAFVKKGL